MADATNDLDRPLRAEDEAYLRQLLGITNPDEKLPEGVLRQYWVRKKLLDRISYPMQLTTLVEIVIAAGIGAPVPQGEPWILRAVRDQRLKAGARIVVAWTGKERNATFLALHTDKKRIRITLDGDTEERLIPATEAIRELEAVTA